MFGIRSFNSLLNLIKTNKLYTLVLLMVIAMFGHYFYTFNGTPPSYKKIKTKFNSLKKKMNIKNKMNNNKQKVSEDILTLNDLPITLEEEVIAKMAPPVFIDEPTKANYEAVLSPNHNASPI